MNEGLLSINEWNASDEYLFGVSMADERFVRRFSKVG